MRRIICCITLISLVAVFGFAQERGGNIYGKVMDESNTPLPGILLTLSGDLIGTMTTISAGNGNFRFLSIPVGTYTLKAELEGFATLVRKGIVIELGSNVTVDMVLVPKKIEEEVVVTATPVAIDQKKTTHATNLTKDELQTIPTARDPFVVLELAPGIVMDRINVGGSESGQQSDFRSMGTYRSAATWNTDGINVTDQVAMGAAPQYYDFDAFEEIQIQTAANDITAMTPGAQITMITKRGGNKFSGGGRFYLTDDAYQSTNAPENFPEEYTPASIHNIKDYGLNIGGPIFKDKLWFWTGGSVQDIQKRELVGDIAVQKLKNFEFKLNAKLGKHRLEGFINWSAKDVTGRISNSARDAWESHYIQTSPHPFYKIQDEFTISDNLFISAKASKFEGGFKLSPIGPVGGIAYYDSATGSYSGTFYESDYIRPQAFHQIMGIGFIENLFGASHELKFGVEYKYFLRKRYRTYYSQRLYFTDLAAGDAYRAYIYRNSNLNLPHRRYSAFFQDSLTFKRLTILLGLRYDFQSGDVGEMTAPATNVDWAGEYNLPAVTVQKAKLNFDFRMFSPRVGLIYDLSGTGKTLLKGNFSMYGYHLDTGFAYGLSSTYGYVYWNWDDTNGDLMVQTDEITRPRVYDYFVQTDASEVYDSNLTSPKTMELMAGIEHELIKDFGVGVNVVYRKFWDDYWDYYYVDDNGTLRLPTPDDWEIGGYIPAEYGGYAWWQYKPGIEETTLAWYQQRPDFYTNYLGLTITFKKRFAANSRWMVNGSVTVQSWSQNFKSRWGYVVNYDPTEHEPNDLVGGTPESYMTPTWMAKLGFSVLLPLEINLAGSLLARQGFVDDSYYTDYSGVTRNGIYDRPSVRIAKRGDMRYPNTFLANLRLERAFKIDFARLIFSIDVFNIFNSNTTQYAEENAGRATYGQLQTIISPRVFRLGVRLDF